MKNTRFAIYAILMAFITVNAVAKIKLAVKGAVIDVRSFGAKGDGITNDYPALIKVAEQVNKNGGGTIYFPKGNYYIGVNADKKNKYPDIAFNNCDGIKITGPGAIITVKGDFNRTADHKNSGHFYSNVNAITPLSFNNCKNIDIEDLEVNGNVNKMTRDAGVVESGSHLLRLGGCQNVILKNLYLHHSQTDGIYITGNTSNVNAENVVSSNNSRQGMSIIRLTDSKFVNCKFMNTGLTEGSYGGDSPRAGVDIEPRGSSVVTVSNIVFQNCHFENNQGAQFIGSTPVITSGITLTDCTVDAKTSGYKYQMILSVKNILLQNCKIDAGVGSVYPVWQGKSAGSSVVIKNCVIRSQSSGIVAVPKTDKDVVTIDHTQLIFTGKTAKYFPYLKMTNLTFTNNSVFIPSKSLSSKSSALVEKALLASGNTFSTDDRSKKAKVSYKGTKSVKDN